ncbi:hypothetical protein AVEN_222015-2-1, partial [Araneus ventricosus]
IDTSLQEEETAIPWNVFRSKDCWSRLESSIMLPL